MQEFREFKCGQAEILSRQNNKKLVGSVLSILASETSLTIEFFWLAKASPANPGKYTLENSNRYETTLEKAEFYDIVHGKKSIIVNNPDDDMIILHPFLVENEIAQIVH